MRYHLTKTSESDTIITGDSQLKHLDFPNVNILLLPGAGIKVVVNFIPEPGKFKTIVLFIGGNDLFDGYLPSSTPIEEVAVELTCLADSLLDVARRVFKIGIPPRIFPESELERLKMTLEYHELTRDRAVNRTLQRRSLESLWGYRGLSERTFSRTHLAD